ncbi:MAG: uncharacterized protein KVP18_002599 [Porospora cf. gigantea A]|uniref:uncharacterized protein n=1 Tax=Porospora cf. gigantea A TaxID=2853593 RepID=UPI003559939E|nr:MAG: hypothetical protein KVP18_002599 [Porospora cf. gigantea A]
MPEHKLRSTEDDLVLHLRPVPKFISEVRLMSPGAFIVGFKLVTDEAELLQLACRSVQANHLDVVVGNTLATRREKLVLVRTSGSSTLEVSLNRVSHSSAALMKTSTTCWFVIYSQRHETVIAYGSCIPSNRVSSLTNVVAC